MIPGCAVCLHDGEGERPKTLPGLQAVDEDRRPSIDDGTSLAPHDHADDT